jgi:hypothetical protein
MRRHNLWASGEAARGSASDGCASASCAPRVCLVLAQRLDTPLPRRVTRQERKYPMSRIFAWICLALVACSAAYGVQLQPRQPWCRPLPRL